MASLYFVVTGIQFWGTAFLRVVLQAPLPLVNILFLVSASTGPTLGVVFGGFAVDLLGGYRGPKQRVRSLEMCCIFAVLGCAFASPITFLSEIIPVVLLLWLVLFFGASILPSCSGILVSVVPHRHRPVSSSLSLIVFNLFGYFLSLVLTGAVMQSLESDPHCDQACVLLWGFRVVLFWSLLSLLFLFAALTAAYLESQKRSAASQPPIATIISA